MFTEHGRHYPDVVSRKRRLLNRLLLAKLADEVNGVCAFSARSLAEKDGFEHRQIDVIENGIDLPTERDSETLSARRARVGLPTDRRYVICVARFHPVKDHATLLRAFARVAASAPDTDLLLAGDGPLRPDLQRQVQELGIAPRVSFLGVRDDVPALLKAADIFALTSVSEAASLTLLEAMGAGLPVVVTDVGGNPEIVRSGVEGVLVPRGDVAAAAHAIESLLHDKHLCVRLGAAARQRVVSAYELDSTIMRYYSRYQAAVAGLRKR
jgi:glycosyltransferase involved in cell wall biosynthesis